MHEPATPTPAPYQTAFPDYDPATLPAIPAHWTDISWHNDSCPSWSTCDERVSIFIDYLDPEDREVPEFPRFVIYHSDLDDNVLRSDDWAEILAKVVTMEAVHGAVPRKPEDEDWVPREKAGFDAFFADAPFAFDLGRDWAQGWGTASTRAYGQGVKCRAAYDADAGADVDEAVNPYPQFSAAGEAWGAGFDDFEVL